MTCQLTSTARRCPTSSSHREPIQAYGQTGSNQKSTATAGALISIASC